MVQGDVLVLRVNLLGAIGEAEAMWRKAGTSTLDLGTQLFSSEPHQKKKECIRAQAVVGCLIPLSFSNRENRDLL